MIGHNLTARPTAVGCDYRALKIAVGFEKLFIFILEDPLSVIFPFQMQ